MRYVRRLVATAAVVVIAGLLPSPARASSIDPITFSFLSGAGTFEFGCVLADSTCFDQDNDVVLVTFDVLAPSTFTAQTTSFALGGFDPVLTLFEPNGESLPPNDDRDPDTGDFDALIGPLTLLPGMYTLALTQSPNFGQVLLQTGFDFDDTPFFTSILYGSNGSECTAFITFDGDCRTGYFAGSLTIEPLAAPVPEPGTLLLVATGTGVLMRTRFSRRRTRP